MSSQESCPECGNTDDLEVTAAQGHRGPVTIYGCLRCGSEWDVPARTS